jgi:exonuclease III
MQKLKRFRYNYPKNIIFHHININSVRYKFNEISSILYDSLADILVIGETKLDDSFPNAQFHVKNFTLHRKDRNQFGGGLMIYINSLIPHCCRKDLSELLVDNIEGLVFEITIKKKKMLFLALYKPPDIKDDVFISCFTKTCESMLSETSNILIVGDLNFNMNINNKLVDCCNVMGFKNLIKSDTCFKGDTPTLLDVILTSNSYMYMSDYINIDTGSSDCHNLIGCIMKAHAPKRINKVLTYRNFKSFNEEHFLRDLSCIDFAPCYTHTDTNDMMSIYNGLFLDTLNKHAPIKTKRIKKVTPPFMNNDLRNAILKKCMLRNKYYKERNGTNWELYRNQRNFVTKLRKQSIRQYFVNKTTGISNSKDFWKVVKPFLTDKNSIADDHIILRNDDNLVTDPLDVCNIFNKYFTNVAKSIGFEDTTTYGNINSNSIHNIIYSFRNHPSILEIKKQNISTSFEFPFATETEVKKIILKLNLKKSMGYDFISPKVLKISAPFITPIITDMINHCIRHCIFPSDLKFAEVSSILKKSDRLNKANYRPISILIILSKVFEKIFSCRMNKYFANIFSPYLSAYRQKFNCEQVLVKFISLWKKALDNNNYFGAVMMDLSKAFDCLPHNLIIAKLYAYGFCTNSCVLIFSYLSQRMQRVKIGSYRSEWLPLDKGVPQGSIMGPILFNIFINDIFYFVSHCQLLNYADDNTVVYSNVNLDDLVNALSFDSNIAVRWFTDNGMQANPEKFQTIISHRNVRNYKPVHVGNAMLEPSNEVTLLGVTFDIDLCFDSHVSHLCKKASRSLNVLKRFSKVLSTANKTNIFHTFITSQFNYCPIVWHFCMKRKSNMIDKIQERALRFVFNDSTSSYNDLLLRMRKDSMHTQRLKYILVFVYKCVNNLGPAYLNSLFSLKHNHYNLRNDILLVQPKMNTVKFGLNSIVYHGSKMWNNLPMYIKTASSVNKFKLLLKRYKKPLCSCENCKHNIV